MTCFRLSLNVAQEWYTTPLAKQWCNARKGATVSLTKRGPRQSGPRRLPRYPSLLSILELAICLVGKEHVTEMKLNVNFIPIRASNSADKLLYF